MNIKDVPVPTIAPETTLLDLAQAMATRQGHLEDHYHIIEDRPSRYIRIDDREGQVAIKDSLWRIVEEIGEALEALHLQESHEKVCEELADALHFLIALCLNVEMEEIWLKGFDTLLIHPGDPLNIYRAVSQFVQSAGIVGNTLKLKAWKQTDVSTDINMFQRNLGFMVSDYIKLCSAFGMSHHDIYQYYMRKSEVNLFRIRSRY